MGFQRLCVAANLRMHRNLTVVTDNVAMLSVLPAEALQGVQLRCFGIPIRRQISSACRRELGSERACQLRSPKEVARNLEVSTPTFYRWLPASERS
jgi:hypothetical protein